VTKRERIALLTDVWLAIMAGCSGFLLYGSRGIAGGLFLMSCLHLLGNLLEVHTMNKETK